MARALNDILTELDSVYNPQRQRADSLYNKQVGELQPQESADLGGLEVAKTNAFESINTGANRRGMFFSGIPLAEQGKYVGENYLPSIAGLKNRYAGIRGNLYQTLAQQLGDIDTKQREFGQGIYNSEVQADIERERIAEEKRQFDARLAAETAAANAARAASGGSGGSASGFNLGGGGTVAASSSAPAAQRVTVKPADQLLYNQMFIKGDGGRWSDNELRSDYNATLASARNGNTRDQAKIRMYHSVRDDLFGAQSPIPLGAIKPASKPAQQSLPVSNRIPTSNLLTPFGR